MLDGLEVGADANFEGGWLAWLNPRQLQYGSDRTNKPVNMELVESIERFGIRMPLLCYGMVWVGNQRLQAAVHMGLERVPCLFGNFRRGRNRIVAREVRYHTPDQWHNAQWVRTPPPGA